MDCVIKHISHPYPEALAMAHRDHAILTGSPVMEQPWWYEDTSNGLRYHDLFACVGWPSEAGDRTPGLPGYVAIVAVIRPKEADDNEQYDAVDAKFLLIEEYQHREVPLLLDTMLSMREKYGFGIKRGLLDVWLGDPRRFSTAVALRNEGLAKDLGSRVGIVIAPPDDLYAPDIFDIYLRSLTACLITNRIRLYFQRSSILKTRLKSFKRDDPAVLAAGGLVHSLLLRTMWMGQIGDTIFNVEEKR
ncbi:MAG TPA: hypothetical protein ENH07_10350 [Nitrospirae bacterium]|nr:hypothetical protein [Nitrospirota bacterium]